MDGIVPLSTESCAIEILHTYSSNYLVPFYESSACHLSISKVEKCNLAILCSIFLHSPAIYATVNVPTLNSDGT
jgi:hypothetical protein